jgi:hypothetical protein
VVIVHELKDLGVLGLSDTVRQLSPRKPEDPTYQVFLQEGVCLLTVLPTPIILSRVSHHLLTLGFILDTEADVEL